MGHNFDDEELVLSSSTMDALKQFYDDRETHSQQFAKLLADSKRQHDEYQPLTMDAFTEDWNESQFWYADETATLLAEELLDGATEDMTVAVVSAPSVFVALKNVLGSESHRGKPRPKLVLLEHDERFAIFPEFVFYDYMHPTRLPSHLKDTVDRVICDPPFLNEDCQTKAALTVRWLARPSTAKDVATTTTTTTTDTDAVAPKPDFRLVVCTGERMEELLVTKLYRSLGLRTTDYEPVHARCLNNEFYCYANFECDQWRWAAGDD